MTAAVHLRPGHVRPVFLGHPWVYAQAIARVDGAPAAGDPVVVLDPRGNALGSGYYSPGSAIPVRLMCRDGGRALDAAFLRGRIADAVALRRDTLGLGPGRACTGWRAVNSEGDGLPGLVVDVFEDSAVVQFLTIGMKRRADALVDALCAVTGVTRVYESTSPRHQKLEGFEATDGLLRGDGPAPLTFVENGVRFALAPPGDAAGGQKTGYYFDQRDNRALVASFARGKRVLDAFAFVGGFGLAAARAGATAVHCIDSGAAAVATGEALARDNGLDGIVRFTRGDVRKVLEALDAEGQRFDLVIVDPPKLAHAPREVEQALGLYRRLNAAAARRLVSGGMLVSCSCSGSVGADDFLRAVNAGVRDAGRDASLLDLRGAALDHPVALASAEGRYLKCALSVVR